MENFLGYFRNQESSNKRKRGEERNSDVDGNDIRLLFSKHFTDFCFESKVIKEKIYKVII